ncbi:hypothetical protein JHK87_049935 [Glycine soja]|nr:hypothetical protein JHK87_049935 [Glycine soja]
MQELQAVKSSEALTLEKLKILRENAMKDRISNNKLREQLVFDTLRGDWMVAFGIWEFDPLKLRLHKVLDTSLSQSSIQGNKTSLALPVLAPTQDWSV